MVKRVLIVGLGYVGTVLHNELSRLGYDVEGCDARLDAPRSTHSGMRYQDLTSEQLARYDDVLWFAGHSSVPAALKEPEAALDNNCMDLFSFAKRIPKGIRLFYASTGSVYSNTLREGRPPALKESEALLDPANAYDASKFAFDSIAVGFLENATGLRLGTVAGHSPRLRRELIFNAMNISAMRDGSVTIANPQAMRSILFLDDLARFVLRLLETKERLPKLLNLASHSLSIDELGHIISNAHGVPRRYIESANHYSFQMDTSLARHLCGNVVERSIQEQCAVFQAAISRDSQ